MSNELWSGLFMIIASVNVVIMASYGSNTEEERRKWQLNGIFFILLAIWWRMGK